MSNKKTIEVWVNVFLAPYSDRYYFSLSYPSEAKARAVMKKRNNLFGDKYIDTIKVFILNEPI